MYSAFSLTFVGSSYIYFGKLSSIPTIHQRAITILEIMEKIMKKNSLHENMIIFLTL